MKNILSILSGRPASLLLSVALVVSFLFPASVMASIEYTLFGEGGSGLLEGDPLDTNDVGGGQGGGSNIVNVAGTDLIPKPFMLEFSRIQVMLIPEYVGGILTFKIMVVDNSAMGVMDLSPEGINAQ